MSADTFLQLAEQGGFVESAIATKLRSKLAGSSRPVSADEIAKLLIDKGLVSAAETKHLLEATRAAASGELTLEENFELRPARKAADTHKPLDVLGEKPGDEDLALLQVTDDSASDGGFMEDGHGPSESDPGSQSAGNDYEQLSPVDDNVGVGLGGSSDLDDVLNEDFSVALKKGWFATLKSYLARGRYRGQRWDSSLMMIGGGALLLLCLIGGAIGYVLMTGSGDEYFKEAEDAYKSQLYTQAIQKYSRYLDRYPRHEKASLAKVRVGLAHIRHEIEKEDWQKALQTAQTRIDSIREEDEFPAARPELAGILPAIYEGFIDGADDQESADAKEALLQRAGETLEIINNPDNLPASQMRQISSRLSGLAQRVDRIERDITRQREVFDSVRAINSAVAAGDSAEAYRLRDALLEKYPGAAKNQRFKDSVVKIAGAEQQSVSVSGERISAKTTERPRPQRQLSAMLSARSGRNAEALNGRVIYTLARGALFAMDGASGKILWRRWLGFDSFTPPVDFEKDAIAVDHGNGDLIRCSAADGSIVWRNEVGAVPSGPVSWDKKLFQVTLERKLMRLDAQSGDVEATASFPQALTCPPGVDYQSRLLFQPGSHSTLYVLDAESLECVQTLFIGHSEGMIQVAPTVTKDHVIVIENGATDYCLLHVLARSDETLRKAGKPIKLAGSVVDPPIAYGRNILVATDRGAVYVLESDPGNAAEPVRVFAQIPPRNTTTSDHYGLLSDERIIVSGTGLSEYEIDSARGELNLTWTDHIKDLYLSPAEMYGDTLVTRRWSPNSADVIVEAAKLPPRGKVNEAAMPIWSTRVAGEPASAPLVLPGKSEFLVAASNGLLWSVDKARFRDGKAEIVGDADFAVRSVIPVGDGLVFTSPELRTNWKFVGSNGKSSMVTLDVAQKRLSAEPTAFGNGMLLCTTSGDVHYASATTGKSLSAPYKPRLGSGTDARWLRPAVRGSNAWLANDEGMVVMVELAEQALKPQTSSDLKIALEGDPILAGDHLFVLARSRKGDTLVALTAEGLEAVHQIPLEARISRGPFVLNNDVVMVLDDGSWQCVSAGETPQVVWKQKLPFGMLAGAPSGHGDEWICAAQNGTVFRVDPKNGDVVPWRDKKAIAIGEPLGSAVTILPKSRLLLISGNAGTLHALPLPGKTP